MDYTALPPEINSARISTGPGAGPMLAAAAAWDRLAGSLNSSAAACRSLVAGLTVDSWRGPSSALMAAAAARYVAWLHSTAAQAEQAGAQARAAAAAYQTALGTTVPLALVTANRAQLQLLVASNYFGQNSPAIAAAEADYERMWAQDATAMHGYQAASAAASRFAPFDRPPVVAAPVPAQPLDPSTLLTAALAVPSATSAAASISSSTFSGISIPTTNHAIAVNAERDAAQGIGPFLAGSTLPQAPRLGISAAIGRASLVSGLSVPQSWAATTPAVGPAAAPGNITTVAAGEPFVPGVFGEAMLGTLAGRGVTNAAAKTRRPSVIPRSPAAG